MNIFLTGPIRVGKSTALKKSLLKLAADGIKIGGFKTYKGNNPYGIHICAYDEDMYFDANNRIGLWDGEMMQANLKVFADFAEKIQKESQNIQLMVMDELGFLEARSDIFQKTVLDILASPLPVTGVLRQLNISWQKPIYQDSKTQLIEISLLNRDQISDLIYEKPKENF
jgi:nucleoside-triphosphatase THEP1